MVSRCFGCKWCNLILALNLHNYAGKRTADTDEQNAITIYTCKNEEAEHYGLYFSNKKIACKLRDCTVY